MDQKFYETIDDNAHYFLTTADLPGVDLRCYAIVSKKYGVVEMSTSVLANARKFLQMLAKWEEAPPDDDVDSDLPDMSGALQ
jgi:hypothetical protein